MDPVRVLFVDDEERIRLTLPEILKLHGFDVTVAGNVPEALVKINAERFEVLISDLNIGEPGDGFVVVSAMRRTQPRCVNFILTGYPDFDTALRAIRSQVDEYLVKPANVRTLVEAIEAKLQARKPREPVLSRQIGEFIFDNRDRITRELKDAIAAIPGFADLQINEAERLDLLPSLLELIASELRSPSPKVYEQLIATATDHGITRQRQGFSEAMLLDERRVIEDVIYRLLQENLLALDLSNLVPHLRELNALMYAQLKHCLGAFHGRAESITS